MASTTGLDVMEGPLSKWTNVVQGWCYRWFVLNEVAGTLAYYTSKDKMMRAQKRGCVRLTGAVVGIDDENDSLFTITVDNKMFHLQSRDIAERDRWIRALELTIHRHSGYYRPRLKLASAPSVSLHDFDRKIAESDQYLQLMIEQVKELEVRASQTENATNRDQLNAVVNSANAMLETVKHGVVMLQMAKSQMIDRQQSIASRSSRFVHRDDDSTVSTTTGDDDVMVHADGSTRRRNDNMSVPPVSYSSSDEEFFDAVSANSSDDDETATSVVDYSSSPTMTNDSTSAINGGEPDYGDEHEDFDAICNDSEETDLGNVQEQHGSVLMHLLSQVSIGMDLTKVTLPTFILERRSLLEMYADFFTHPDDFVATTDMSTAEQRFIGVVRYYCAAFYAARKSGVAKKPYNPILGETFRCRWDVPGLAPAGVQTLDGPYPGADVNQLTFIAEQVSHHPPISAFYAEHPGKKISFGAHIWTKSSFLGLSIGVHNIGSGCVKLHEHGEEYIVTFPSGYGRSIISTPWVELGGKVKISCAQTGYYADIEFLTKPFFGGKAHRMTASIYRPGFKKAIVSIRGEWNGVMTVKKLNGDESLFVDVKAKPEVKKQCDRIADQTDRESRRLWRHVTAALRADRIQVATTAKRWIEQRQRDEAKVHAASGNPYRPQLFNKVSTGADNDDGGWMFAQPFERRNVR